MRSLTVRYLCTFWIGLAVVVSTSHALASSPNATNLSEPTSTSSEEESNRAAHGSHTHSTSRVDILIDRATEEGWDANRLFSYLELDDAHGCLDFSDRTRLRERHARWSEAIAILDRIDPDTLDAWILGLQSPPSMVEQEVQQQLQCLLEGLIDAVDEDSYDVRLFTNITNHFDGRFQSAAELAGAIEAQPFWLGHTLRALTRSTFRNLHSQAHIWHRKFIFSGRAFNRISEEAAEQCGLHGERIWRPDSNRHRHCWQDLLSTEQREREILSASAGPGLSRHHWGTDVDILGLNPVLFQKGAVLHDDWRWLDDHGLDYGFFQTYRDLEVDGYAHMEEPWHWSYYPIAQALWDFAKHNPERIEGILFEQWDRLERIWGPAGGPYFDHLRQHWQDYFFHIYLPSIDAASPPPQDVDSHSPLPSRDH